MQSMARALVMALVLFLPALGFSTSIGFANTGGTLAGSTLGLDLTGSQLTAIITNTTLTGDLGTLTFSTGGLLSGSLESGGTFASGGAFVITGNGTDGIPNGVIFNGTFSGPVTWALITLGDGTHSYTLTGALMGTWFTGVTVNGATVELTMNTGTGFFTGSVGLASGDTDISGVGIRIAPTPEPGALGLVGAGLISLAIPLWRRVRSA